LATLAALPDSGPFDAQRFARDLERLYQGLAAPR